MECFPFGGDSIVYKGDDGELSFLKQNTKQDADCV